MKRPFLHAPATDMLELLEELAAFSTPGPGVTRLLYTPEWSGAQHFLQEKMAGLGLEVHTDPVGNVFGRLSGSQDSDKVILTGSHIDTVVNGGKYDGAYGVAAAVTAMHYLAETFGPPLRTLEVAAFCEEEGSRFPLTFWGSGNVTGLYNGSVAESVSDLEGITLMAAMESCGLPNQGSRTDHDNHGDRLMNSARRDDIGMYVELHIEQGIILEQSAQQIGVVQAIVGQRRFTARVIGTANHAGTTPMGLRQDALAGTAEMLSALEQFAVEAGEPLVATTGRLEVFPGTSNVIPGEVQFTLDIRHSEAERLESFCSRVMTKFGEIAARRGLKLELEQTLATSPAPMNPALCEALEHICQEQGRSFRSMVSGAGHDAQLFAPRCPAAMIFVPSRAGISHSPEEYSSPEELAAGLDVLTALLYKLAYEES
ncbi:M20 family metallo-hydrolase [Paenibacillus sp. P32E]|uniref:M20 family metallo-hydrolase n=1 Tax=Paenibacillus sp. P32E TaxID=1349434 RepID=UPI00093F0857|nr:M20 family metallo-hydrolase [Paenibacillus sp. P32E]OKP89439.1 allantoate amidohydrolase [Paenibacillus sp. P32E]